MTDSALAPVTQSRMERHLDELNLTHFRGESDGLTRTGFPGLVCFFQFEEVGYKITARWLPVCGDDTTAAALRRTVNELNRSLPLVRAHPVRRDDGTTVVLAEAPFFTSGGIDDEQLAQQVAFFFSTIHHVKDVLERKFPALAGKEARQ